ncbi:DUF1272 domain-containing protein [Roseobacter sp. CCS2]|uniref:DUF1272 domain-containing protein n=1 Tax=Roseobacter sp. CCS2 TaxID=391593 RepID=UPI0000F40655|nr:DUF1272 domain-containing protein [Roseobacter sp. CCS2]EBA11337.1 hypothetical protein RCCS2_01723 [Roseobacter sp. CCS2]
MLELRPNCEWCDKDLPPDADDARICTYECTYCAKCVADVLKDVCPTCGGNFVPRPIRPKTAYHDTPKLGLGHQPVATKRHYSRWTTEQVERMAALLKDVAAKDR